ncbi:MAG: hypothetical protein ACKV2V_09665 [Blastocatellia bacterium]
MKTIFSFTRMLTATALLGVLMIAGLAHGTHDNKGKKAPAAQKGKSAKFLGMGDGMDTCPVTGEAIKSKTVSAELMGRTVYFCCPGCMATAKKAPAKYIKKTHEEQLAAIKANVKPGEQAAEHGDHHAAAKPAKKDEHAGHDAPAGAAKFLGKGDGVTTCPVTGEAIDKSVKVDVAGRTVYACCEGCLDKIKTSPDLYLKKQ